MPVSPKEQPTKEGLSYNGETAESGKQTEVVDAVGQMDGCALPGETGAMEQEKVEGVSDYEDEEGEEEARASVGKKSPKDPTRKQREEHSRTHMPYRSWCEDCVRSRARNAPHHKKAPGDPLERIKVPRVHMDYFFVSREHEAASSNPMLVMLDERSGSRYARLVGKKV